MTRLEYSYPGTPEGEQAAHAQRRKMIAGGATVSLIAYDPERDLYTFDAE